MGVCSRHNTIFPLTKQELTALKSLRRRAERAAFEARETSSVIDMLNSILDLEDAAAQKPCPYGNRELYERVQTVDGPMLVRLS